MTVDRNVGIDAFRIIAFLAVVMLHALPNVTTEVDAYNALNLCSRFAVPFFFIVSGYFIQKSNAATLPAVKKLFLRIFPVFIIWLLIYWIAFAQYQEPIYPKLIAYTLISGFPTFHLWFLPALGISGVMLIFMRRLPSLYLILIGMLFYSVTLIFGSYKDFFAFEMPQLGGQYLKARFGPFMGLLFMVVGFVIARHDIEIKKIWVLLFLIVGGGILEIMESYFLHLNGIDVVPMDHFLGTILLGAGVFLYAKQLKASPVITILARFGYLSLGSYCIHLLFLHFLKERIGNDTAQNFFLLFAFVSALSIFVSWIGTKIPFVRKIFI